MPGKPANVANHNLLGFLFVTDHRGLAALYALLSTFNVTQTGYASHYANAFRDSNRLYPVQIVTTSIACHILLNRLHLDYVASWKLCW